MLKGEGERKLADTTHEHQLQAPGAHGSVCGGVQDKSDESDVKRACGSIYI